MKKTIKYIFLLFVASTLALASCKKDDPKPEPELPKATLENIEVGSGNNEQGIISRDFHFNADIVAGDRIDEVSVKIVAREGETYASEWSFEVVWDQYKGMKNTNVHKHFTIPEDAVPGIYDFLIIVTDENGSVTEQKRNLNIILPEDLPVDPILVSGLRRNGKSFYNGGSGKFFIEGDNLLKKDDALLGSVVVTDVKGSGQIISFLVKKSHAHRPESVQNIDFSKVIVLSDKKHTDLQFSSNFSSVHSITIGAETDNATTPEATVGDKDWESGDYLIGALYHNSTYNVNIYHYIDFVKIDMD